VVSLPHITLTLIEYTLISVAIAVIVAESVEKERFEEIGKI
jgi:Flp pilus assembly pilin Flp